MQSNMYYINSKVYIKINLLQEKPITFYPTNQTVCKLSSS